MKTFWAIVVLFSLFLILWTTPLHAAPFDLNSFEGTGVGWASDGQNVEHNAKLLGFSLLQKRSFADGTAIHDYQGTFLRHPAKLSFTFNKDGRFYVGAAEFLDVPNPHNLDSAKQYYDDIVKNYTDKYGEANKVTVILGDHYNSRTEWNNFASSFFDWFTAGKKIRIEVALYQSTEPGKYHVTVFYSVR